MIVSIQNGNPFVLNRSGTDYYWENNLVIALPSPPVFAATGTLSNLTLTDPSTSGGIGFKADGVTLTQTNPPAALQMNQSTYATWAPPALFLSMVTYTLSNLGGTVGQIETTDLTITLPANNLIILPLIWYYGTSGQCVETNVNTPGSSLVTWFCNVNPGSYGQCPSPLVTTGWTQLNDCNAGVNYTYCPVTQTCGTGNCNGPCPTTATTCTFNAGTFECQGITELWTEPWFLVVIIGLGLIVLALFIAAVVIANKKGSNKDETVPMANFEYDNY